MTPEVTTTAIRPEAEEEAAPIEATLEVEDEESEDFNPLGKIEGWSAFECSSGPFGHRG